ncbi:VOC family protein [bacterium]|jgi:catechol 2,3-dioxygenase-like lactoylglutathione lyase family enzyme|nr:VOC family protein [bacterium]
MTEQKKAALDHLNLTVRNFEEAANWYGKVFGFRVVEQGLDDGRPWGVLRSGDSMLCIYENPGLAVPRDEDSEKFYKIYHFGLRIQNREVWEKTLREHRLATYYGSPLKYPHSTSWYVTDPTGHMIEVALWDNDQVRFAG